MARNNAAFSLFIAVVVLILTAVPSFATLDINTGIGLREEYNDNIFLDSSAEEDDFITTVSPGISLSYSPHRTLDLNLDYGLNFKFYKDHSELNETNIDEAQSVEFETKLRPLKRVYIDVADTYRRVPVDVRRKAAFENVFTNMTDSNVFSVSPYIEYPLTSTLASRLGYGYTNTWYRIDEGNDSESHSAFVSLIKKFVNESSISLNYNYLAYQPEETEDYEQHQGSVSITYRIKSNFFVNGGAGYNYLDFSESDNEEAVTWNVGTGYTINIMGGTSLGCGYSETLSETNTFVSAADTEYPELSGTEDYVESERSSVITGVTKRKIINVYLTAGTRLKVKINTYYSVDEELKTDREDKIKGATINITRPLSSRTDISLDGLFEEQKFLPEDEIVDRYSAGFSIGYDVSRLIDMSVGYRYNRRDAELDTEDFTNNIAWVQTGLSF